MASGYEWREQRIWERTGWAVCHMLNVSGKVMRSKVTVRQLLKRPVKARDQAEWWARVEKQRAKRRQLREAAEKEESSD